MTQLRFPIERAQDQRFFRETPVDPVMRSETEGGWEITRPRFTRRPRRIYRTGWSHLTTAEKNAWDDFYNQIKGGSEAFLWRHPTTNQEILVRLSNAPSIVYAHYRQTPDGADDHRWNLHDVELKEV